MTEIPTRLWKSKEYLNGYYCLFRFGVDLLLFIFFLIALKLIGRAMD